jgi:hypothetical protein
VYRYGAAFEKAAARFTRVRRFAAHGNPTRAVLRQSSREAARRELGDMFRRENEGCGGGSDGDGGDGDGDSSGVSVASGSSGGGGSGGGSGVGGGGGSGGGGETIAANDNVLVVLGGSLGAAAINAAVRGAIPTLLSDDTLGGNGASMRGEASSKSNRASSSKGGDGRTWVVWQAGESGFDEIRAKVPRHPRLLLTPFIDRMEVVYGAADLAVARAGAITCSELLATRISSVGTCTI